MLTSTKATQWRKAAYAIISAVLAILAAIGIITAEQASSWLDIAAKMLEILTPLVGSIALAVASSKVHRGSDDDSTVEDVAAAREQGYRDAIREVQRQEPTMVTVEPLADDPVSADALQTMRDMIARRD